MILPTDEDKNANDIPDDIEEIYNLDFDNIDDIPTDKQIDKLVFKKYIRKIVKMQNKRRFYTN